MTDETRLRHPWEHTIFVASMVLNLGIMLGALVLIRTGGDWLKGYPLLADSVRYVEALATAALFAPPAIIFIRNARRGFILGNTVRVSPQQFPEMYEVLEGHCRRLGLDRVPGLYLSDDADYKPALAYSVWGEDYIVLGEHFLDPKTEVTRDVLAFILGSELGRLRLGHTRWWYELLLAYIIRIPYLRNPMTQVETLSRDRYGAFLAPGGIRGLVVQACGRRMLPIVNLNDYLGQVREYGGVLALVFNLTKSEPHISYRINALLKAGLLETTPDLQAPVPA
jgi:Zn-dependent protease with chaperone function